MEIIGWIGGIVGSGFGLGKIISAFKALGKLKKIKRILKETGEAVKEFNDIKPEAEEFYRSAVNVVERVKKNGIDSVKKEDLLAVIMEGKDVVKEIREFAEEAQDVIDIIKK